MHYYTNEALLSTNHETGPFEGFNTNWMSSCVTEEPIQWESLWRRPSRNRLAKEQRASILVVLQYVFLALLKLIKKERRAYKFNVLWIAFVFQNSIFFFFIWYVSKAPGVEQFFLLNVTDTAHDIFSPRNVGVNIPWCHLCVPLQRRRSPPPPPPIPNAHHPGCEPRLYGAHHGELPCLIVCTNKPFITKLLSWITLKHL